MIIAIIGATGLVGRNVLKILDEFGYIKNNQILLYASEKSDGKILEINNTQFHVQKLAKKTINKNINFAFFCAGNQVSKKWANRFTKNGTIVIDNSSAFRRKKNVPLVVPEINFDLVDKSHKIIANPNCSTIGLSLVLSAISKVSAIKRVIVSTYQAVSGAGQQGIQDLKQNTTKKFCYKISNNLLPQIDKFLPNNYTYEEDKLMYEINKILNYKIPLSATCVRVPIINCHSESVNIELQNHISQKTLVCKLSNASGLRILDNPEANQYPMPLLANGKNSVFVGRIRKDPTQKNTFNLFLCFDNIRKGAALNAVQIMIKYVDKFFAK